MKVRGTVKVRGSRWVRRGADVGSDVKNSRFFDEWNYRDLPRRHSGRLVAKRRVQEVKEGTNATAQYEGRFYPTNYIPIGPFWDHQTDSKRDRIWFLKYSFCEKGPLKNMKVFG